MPDRYQIESCQRRFQEGYSHFIRQTPVWKLPGKALGVDCAEVWLKLEQLQTGGSFKARGMLNRLLSNPIPSSGVIVASGGNAGIATAAAARELGVRCEVFVPEVSSPAKRAKLAALGAEVVVTGAAYSEALQACLARHRQLVRAARTRGGARARTRPHPVQGARGRAAGRCECRRHCRRFPGRQTHW
jgi:threonine dehydratase